MTNPGWEMDATNIHSDADYKDAGGLSIEALPSELRAV